MTGFFLVLGIFLWIMVALWPAYFAMRKGYSFILFLILGWITSFVVALIVALIVPDKNKPATTKAEQS